MRLQPGAGGIHASGSTAPKTFAGGRPQHLLLLGACSAERFLRSPFSKEPKVEDVNVWVRCAGETRRRRPTACVVPVAPP